ncbi:dihydroxyacetone kinase phosphoryl donor subunit DhaM [Enterococcus asini]|uniref:phosphoenolpyruvate--glycerone phosphotransferase n=1 Tax=Enterococcus asini TaxID=57732 RepID=A0AAW8U569_9ENTE|nr:dihydroxyacetone kinase phosphoryl donor subunit DhaM [Enterococcus asini]MCD5028477.1 PTS-dependent dihydroxyacetone kinase phosphotransferase subunit DhaM [Enterococcus asini]MDT2743154.1 dihydroxyacetone kinase phosphoryl donor subunit DhaM [Enterococcus asini]MDT2763192.1 dihydroxyacetone kinase phosphoryl donor subunit DhaM [Enterococcus asini]MDT2783319.1 dihydroxyacetone kinase phosphoryl donor subunit DhaM [Enterococcus asini]MDT2811073.1 dihydroxyacetone kinase phosphoryl donor sub
MSRGVILVSHTKEIPEGLQRLIGEVAKNVPITTAGGLEDGGIGTSMERITQAIEDNPAEELLAFYDLGSAKMNLEMAIEMTTKKVTLFDTAMVESAYTACALLAADAAEEEIEKQLAELKIK